MRMTNQTKGSKKRNEDWKFILVLIIILFAVLMWKYFSDLGDPTYSGREHSWMLPYFFVSLCCGIWISATYHRAIGYLALGLVILAQTIAASCRPEPFLVLVLGTVLGNLLFFGIGHLIGRFYR